MISCLKKVYKSENDIVLEQVKAKYIPAGDSAFLVHFGEFISEEINRRLQLYLSALQKDIQGKEIFLDIIPSYADILVCYDPLMFTYEEILSILKKAEKGIKGDLTIPSRLLEIPVCYGKHFGQDLAYVANTLKMTPEEIIHRHSKSIYRVYMLGFTPGFSYLGGMDDSLRISRRKTPREQVLPGSVGIAGVQTGIYAVESPGGWQLIGRTPLRLFSPQDQHATLLTAGDRVRFKAVVEEEYRIIEEKVKDGSYQLVIEE